MIGGVLTALLFFGCNTLEEQGGTESQQGAKSQPTEAQIEDEHQPGAPDAATAPAVAEVIKLESRQGIQAESQNGGAELESADFILPEIHEVPEVIDPSSMPAEDLSMMLLKQKEKELEMEELDLLAAQSMLKKSVKERPAAILKVSEADQEEGPDNSGIKIQPEEKKHRSVRNDADSYSPPTEQAALSTPPLQEAEIPPERVRDIWARRGDQVEISFGSRGWVFLGLRNSRELKGLIFMGSKDLDGKVIFHFRSEDYGVYLLEFQLQDNRRATVKNESVRLSVVTLEEFDSRLASAAIGISDKGEGEHFLLAEKHYGLGQYEAALKEYISGYREGLPLVNDRIASIYLRNGQYQAAAKFYEKNRLSGGELGEKAVIGLVRSYQALEDPTQLYGLLDKFLGIEYFSIEEELLRFIQYESRHGEAALTCRLLTEYVSRFPGGVFLDEVYFLFGRLYEGESLYRDLERSREYYLRVYEEFPLSNFNEEAGERVRYLDRYFFYIR